MSPRKRRNPEVVPTRALILQGLTRVDKTYYNRKGYVLRKHGWHATFQFEGRVYTKWFGDATYGSRLTGYFAASDWLRNTQAAVGAPTKYKEW